VTTAAWIAADAAGNLLLTTLIVTPVDAAIRRRRAI
jgi:hypothetical protein